MLLLHSLNLSAELPHFLNVTYQYDSMEEDTTAGSSQGTGRHQCMHKIKRYTKTNQGMRSARKGRAPSAQILKTLPSPWRQDPTTNHIACTQSGEARGHGITHPQFYADSQLCHQSYNSFTKYLVYLVVEGLCP